MRWLRREREVRRLRRELRAAEEREEALKVRVALLRGDLRIGGPDR